MVHLRNVLARSELAVADYYMRRSAFVAAANRARYILETYPQAEATPEALVVLVEANYKLGLEDEANNALRVDNTAPDRGVANYQGFDEDGNLILAERIRNRDRSWTNVMTLGLLDRPEVPPPIRIKHPDGFVPPEVAPQPEEEKPKRKGWFSWLPFVG